MITVMDAKEKIMEEVPALPKETIPLENALGRVLAEEIVAPVSLPLQDNSAMDGFALRSEETHGAIPSKPVHLKVLGDHCAGDPDPPALQFGESYRIMTGATLPTGADAVVMKEKVKVVGETLRVFEPVQGGKNVRRAGEEIQRGKKIIEAGVRLSTRHVGFLAHLGISQVKIYRVPRVSIIITGSELIAPGAKLSPGKIFDSNSFLLNSALKNEGIVAQKIFQCGDEYPQIRGAIEEALEISDLILITGGVSVGEYDFSKKALEDLGVEEIFWRVAQKPAKPLYFGKAGRRLVFGLPGNPASVYLSYFFYVTLALKKFQGQTDKNREFQWVDVEESLEGIQGKTLFLRGVLTETSRGNGAKVLGAQGSHMLSSLAYADGFLELPPEAKVSPGKDKIKFYPFLRGGI